MTDFPRTIGVGWTEDFETFHQVENAFLPFNRNGVLFPRKIDGRFAMLSRPSDNGHTPFGDVFYSESPDLCFWGRHRHVMGPVANSWQATKVGGGPVPIETPEGPNIGLINSLALYARTNKYGFLETPYRKVKAGKVTDQVDYLTADEEDRHVIAQANEPINDAGSFVGERVLVRRKGGEQLAAEVAGGAGHEHARGNHYLPFGSWCMSLKWISPGAHMCLTGSTSTWITAQRPAARLRSSAGPSAAGSATRSPCAPIDSASLSKAISPRSALIVSSGPSDFMISVFNGRSMNCWFILTMPHWRSHSTR